MFLNLLGLVKFLIVALSHFKNVATLWNFKVAVAICNNKFLLFVMKEDLFELYLMDYPNNVFLKLLFL